MSEAGDRELEVEARALLLGVKEPPATPADVRARVARRLALAIPLDGPGGSGGGPPPAPAPAPSALGRALAARVPAWSLLASFVAGGGLVLALRQPAATRVEATTVDSATRVGSTSVAATRVAATTVGATPVDSATWVGSTSVAATTVGATTVDSATRVGSTPVAATPVGSTTVDSATPVGSTTVDSAKVGGSTSVPAPAPRPTLDSTLDAERALLDIARTAIARGDGPNALRAAEQHARRFPRGALTEEREAMIIQALRLLRRDDDADARLRRFRDRFPSSMLRPALEADAGGAP